MSVDASLSHVRGASTPPLREDTIGQALDEAARRWGDIEGLISVHQGVRWTYAELRDRAEALAAGFLALGLVPGDRVGIWSPNNAEWALTQFAAAKAGLILVTINPAYRISELEYTLAKVGVRVLVAAERFKTSDYVAMAEAAAPGIVALERLIKIGGAPRPGWLVFAEVSGLGGAGERAALGRIGAELDCNDPINIQFTSGTTGLPKGATLSHRNILNNGFFVGEAIGLREGDRLCIPVPLYHCFGMVMGNLGCLTHGAAMVYPSEGFEAGAVLAAVEAERCTGLYGVPTMFIAELAHPEFERFDLSSLRTGCMAGSPCPVEVMKQVTSRMHMRDVTIAYGMTETSPVSFQSSGADPLERRVSTVGRVQPHVECKVVGPDGETVPRGQPGELCTRGYSVMLGYWDEPEKTAEAIDGYGWMHTGDLAVIDEAGYGNIVGRIKDMVIRGGENVYPREIEEFLFRHPKIEEVAVVGVPDPRYGEELCAWVRLRAGEACEAEEVIAFCRGQIAHYKVPRYVRFVDALPMTVTGKIRKFEIREAMIAELGLVAEKTA
ncbi:AMP-binding protein [Phenylobacterium montanum]|uniref:3-methylmercaptopropionyl-CoA ligase n=1 Tax=Phenylobacterium montanum TaxID=2823693 RepID=A0A975G3L4_9CAUL|nr:AMP-binding protein [Caulobacter sp. S6]QUD90051.1 AMP-binding protein [Caulobacter sp. S6]